MRHLYKGMNWGDQVYLVEEDRAVLIAEAEASNVLNP